MFMRAVKSRAFFEQMKGRGVRVIKPDDLQSVTPDAKAKDHFVIVDAVGVCEQDKTDSRPMEQKPTVSFEKLMQAVAFGNIEDDVLTSLAGRLARMEHRLTAEDDKKIRTLSGGLSVKDLSHRIVAALNPDRHIEQAKADLGIAPNDDRPISADALRAAREKVLREAVKPLNDGTLRTTIDATRAKNEVVIDIISADEVIEVGFSPEVLDRAKGVVQSFEKFIEEHKDEITALQVLYSRPYKQRLTFEAVKELAEAIEQPPYLWNESQLWNAYAALEKSKVKGASGRRILTDLVSLVRFAIHQDNELVPFPERVSANFRSWLASQERSGTKFSNEQRRWLEMIRDHVAANLGIDTADFEYAPFSQHGGLGRVHQLFGDRLAAMIAQLNEVLAA
jgi:type I restriction enzyme R subunit